MSVFFKNLFHKKRPMSSKMPKTEKSLPGNETILEQPSRRFTNYQTLKIQKNIQSSLNYYKTEIEEQNQTVTRPQTTGQGSFKD